jgi:hypothetical protein
MKNTEQVDLVGFDYSGIEPAAAGNIRGMAERIRKARQSTATIIVAIGTELIEAKSLLPHGVFGPWLAAEFGWSERTARNYMAVASAFGGRSAIIAGLAPTALYRLAAPSTPASIRADVLNRLEHGERLSDTDIADRIRTARPHVQQRKHEQQQSGTAGSQRNAAAPVPALPTPQTEPPPIDHFNAATEAMIALHGALSKMPRIDRDEWLKFAYHALEIRGIGTPDITTGLCVSTGACSIWV